MPSVSPSFTRNEYPSSVFLSALIFHVSNTFLSFSFHVPISQLNSFCCACAPAVRSKLNAITVRFLFIIFFCQRNKKRLTKYCKKTTGSSRKEKIGERMVLFYPGLGIFAAEFFKLFVEVCLIKVSRQIRDFRSW